LAFLLIIPDCLFYINNSMDIPLLLQK